MVPGAQLIRYFRVPLAGITWRPQPSGLFYEHRLLYAGVVGLSPIIGAKLPNKFNIL